jgi:hypothetical protein
VRGCLPADESRKKPPRAAETAPKATLSERASL